MKKALLLIVVLCIFAASFSGCMAPFFFANPASFESSEASFETPSSSPDTQYYEYEAADWLIKNNQPQALAAGRFRSTAEALKFVDLLYLRGAVAVMAYGEAEASKSLTYADCLYVILPKDNQSRQELFAIYQKEVLDYGCNSGDLQSGFCGDTLDFDWSAPDKSDENIEFGDETAYPYEALNWLNQSKNVERLPNPVSIPPLMPADS